MDQPCPNCGHVRTAADTNPAWQCPRCHIAYAKYSPTRARASFTRHREAIVQRASTDNSLLWLVAVNGAALVAAVVLRMDLRGLMLVYWAQSVAIGIAHFLRILALKRFDVEGVKMNEQPVEETEGAKTGMAFFFLVHFGFFHFVYLMFLAPDQGHPLQGPLVGYIALAGLFLVFHLFSLRKNIASDAEGRPNIGKLMMLPYARIFPMHFTILSGALFFKGVGLPGLLLFGVLKTVADCAMHLANHHLLGKGPEPKLGGIPADALGWNPGKEEPRP